MWIKEIFSFLGFCLKVDIIVKVLSALSEQMWIEIFFAGNWKLTAITTTFLIKNQIHFISLNKIRAHTKAQHTDKKKNSSYNVSLSRFSVMIKVTNHHTANFHYEGKSHSLFHKQIERKKNNSVVDEKRIHLKMILGSFSSFVPFFRWWVEVFNGKISLPTVIKWFQRKSEVIKLQTRIKFQSIANAQGRA